MGGDNSAERELKELRRQNERLRAQIERGRELPQDLLRRILSAERARMSMGRTRKSTFTAPGISSMQSMLREY